MNGIFNGPFVPVKAFNAGFIETSAGEHIDDGLIGSYVGISIC